ncbi:MAG: transcriptional regulator NrdR [Simkaniaceae bacterium]|nr:transcriptional regulator NrdR [Simkaniaceae bacterium]
MKCPFCGHVESKVTDSRNANEMNAVRRRRECLECAHRFTTFETVDLTIQVKKRDGSFEDFAIDKMTRGLQHACQHTRISREQVRTLASEIAKEIMELQVREISTMEIGEIVMRRLHDLDRVAYIRFACVYRRFKDMDQLLDVIETLASDQKVKL